MKIVPVIARYLLGVVFLVFGLNGFLNFIPQGNMPTGAAGQYVGVLMTTHYMVLVFVLQIVGGILLLINWYVPLALTLLGPVLVNILLFHSLMYRTGLPLAIVVTILWLRVAWNVRSAFVGIFRPQGQTGSNANRY